VNVPESVRKALIDAVCNECARMQDVCWDFEEKMKIPEDPMWSMPGDHAASLEKAKAYLARLHASLAWLDCQR